MVFLLFLGLEDVEPVVFVLRVQVHVIGSLIYRSPVIVGGCWITGGTPQRSLPISASKPSPIFALHGLQPRDPALSLPERVLNHRSSRCSYSIHRELVRLQVSASTLQLVALGGKALDRSPIGIVNTESKW